MLCVDISCLGVTSKTMTSLNYIVSVASPHHLVEWHVVVTQLMFLNELFLLSKLWNTYCETFLKCLLCTKHIVGLNEIRYEKALCKNLNAAGSFEIF